MDELSGVTAAGICCFLRAAICAESLLRISTNCALRVVKALRIRKFLPGNFRPASGLKSMNRAMSSASILSVFARVPRERAAEITKAETQIDSIVYGLFDLTLDEIALLESVV